MRVRLFIPPIGNGEGDYQGQDYDFEVLPQPGQLVRTTYQAVVDYQAERIGFIQDGEEFVACVWLRELINDDIGGWIKGMKDR
ncbi:hypothetical protein BRX36_21490 [Sphingomonas sp. S-NIH.Pt1_0416]|uniref:hypothetical protein n=1 Tax=Sphingomonas TaxID=13687 RepID=UPI000F7E2E94|nr:MULTISPECIES: hypothetical protein [Sphingomonas]QBE91480.1 hypothetical protein DRN02_005170 [Sphingomonas paucimobilis]RSU56050.1 hypothetical protein BRX36_21490 [Sphingomonas sp. S-NIH.Pt1_0416]